ncbi:MAG: hypothetical protein LQ345_005322 [Seirophora villosa]|nr:MAG: hypothetical protein LQ345_005322 [Seirophora villosa]
MAQAPTLPQAPALQSNIHISTHPCVRAKLSQIRSKDANARETQSLVHEIALLVACDALASGLQTVSTGTDETPLGYEYTTETAYPKIALVPILRSGLGMVDALQSLLPSPAAVHHLGLFREPTTLQPVEYYNNLPYHHPSGSSADPTAPLYPDIAILLDPIIATGGTSVAAIQTLLEWGVKKVIVIAILASQAPSNPDEMSNPNGGSLPPDAYLADPPDFHAPSSVGREIGVMFAFISLFPLSLIIYYYAWRWANYRESDAEFLRLERLANHRESGPEWVPLKRLTNRGFGVMREMPRRPVAARKGVMAARSGNRGWRDRWRWSGMAIEGPGGQAVATTMVMSTGAGHGGGELP